MPAFVQKNHVLAGVATGTIPVAYPAPNTNGNLLIGFAVNTAAATGVTDTAGNNWTQVQTVTRVTDSLIVSMWACLGCQYASANTATVTFNSALNTCSFFISEYTGVNALDNSTSASNTGVAGSTTLTTSNATDLIVAYGNMAGGVITGPGAGFTSRDSQGSFPTAFNLLEDQNVVSSGSQTVAFTSSANNQWILIAAAYKSATGFDVPQVLVTVPFGVCRVGVS